MSLILVQDLGIWSPSSKGNTTPFFKFQKGFEAERIPLCEGLVPYPERNDPFNELRRKQKPDTSQINNGLFNILYFFNRSPN